MPRPRRSIAVDVAPAQVPLEVTAPELRRCAICRGPSTLRYVVGIGSARFPLPICSPCDGERSPDSFDLDARLDAAARMAS